MSHLLSRVAAAPLCLALAGLAGCGVGNLTATADPASPVTKGFSLQGTVYGGHAPIVGAEVFVLTPGVSGYGSASTDTMTNTSLPTDSTFGYRYVTTNASGFFNISGDYACTPNYPVYVAAYGGNPNTSPTVAITGETVSGPTAGLYTLNFTNSGTNLLYQGETITLTGFTGTFAYLNNTAQTVLSNADLTTTSFDIQVASNGGNANNTYAVAGNAFQPVTSKTSNPAAMNLAVLGICPSSGSPNFQASVSYIFMNEVSTVAAAYSLAQFAVDAVHIGIPAPASHPQALIGLQNAALTANQLYDIQNATQGTSGDGDAHIARTTTPAGNGVVPYALINTLGNLLANCIDSADTASGQSPQCAVLFNTATSNGLSTGVKPTNTASAAINIARNPGANVATLLNSINGNVPFSPALTATPNDLVVAIKYPSSIAANAHLLQPQSVSIDYSGNVWATDASSGRVTEQSPLGAILQDATFGDTAGSPSYGAVDPSNDFWWGDGNAINIYVYEVTSAGTNPATGTAGQAVKYTGPTGNPFVDPYPVAIDAHGHNYIGNSFVYNLVVITGSAAAPTATTLATPTTAPNCFNSGPNHLAVDNQANGANLWETSQTANAATCKFNSSGTLAAGFPATAANGMSYPTYIAVDAAGNAWVPQNTSNTLAKIPQNGTNGTIGLYTGGGLNGPFGIAIDSRGVVYVANRSGNSLSAFTSAGVAITSTAAYTAGGTLADPLNMGIDPSGNLWIGDYNGNAMTEFVGFAGPVVTPLSAASGTNQLATAP